MVASTGIDEQVPHHRMGGVLARHRRVARSTLCDVTIIDPTADQRRFLERHLDELDLWNRRLNLTGVPRERAWGRHVEESLALLRAAHLAAASSCADLGSGGGIPGVVVAVLRPDVQVTLIESDRRKAGFLVHVCGLLGLPNVSVVDRRAEDLAHDPHHARCDAVVSRAAAPPPLLWTLSKPLLNNGGTLWALVASADAAAAVTELAGDPTARVERPAPGILAVHRLGD
jgi:16S rRNA (guanine(527)-N(7))-methyltransferase RsmG